MLVKNGHNSCSISVKISMNCFTFAIFNFNRNVNFWFKFMIIDEPNNASGMKCRNSLASRASNYLHK